MPALVNSAQVARPAETPAAVHSPASRSAEQRVAHRERGVGAGSDDHHRRDAEKRDQLAVLTPYFA